MLINTPQGTKDVPVTEVTKSNYQVPAGEEHLYHAVIEVRKFDPNSGNRLSVPRIQKFGKKTFETTVSPQLKKQGYQIDVLHDPNQWMQQNQQKLADQQAEQQRIALENKQRQEQEAKEKQEQEIQDRIDAGIQKAMQSFMNSQKQASPETKSATGETKRVASETKTDKTETKRENRENTK